MPPVGNAEGTPFIPLTHNSAGVPPSSLCGALGDRAQYEPVGADHRAARRWGEPSG